MRLLGTSLTTRNCWRHRIDRLTNSNNEIPTFENNAEYWLKVYCKLKDMEDAEEQGLYLRLPCKEGTDVYYILGIPNKTPCTIDSCVFELSDTHKIGESLFLTRGEAKAKLKEMEGNHDGE